MSVSALRDQWKAVYERFEALRTAAQSGAPEPEPHAAFTKITQTCKVLYHCFNRLSAGGDETAEAAYCKEIGEACGVLRAVFSSGDPLWTDAAETPGAVPLRVTVEETEKLTADLLFRRRNRQPRPVSSDLPMELRSYPVNGPDRRIRVFCGSLTKTGEPYDAVVCSAFKNEYTPLRSTLIGALQTDRGISVGALAKAPALDLRSIGCWLSAPLEGDFKRVACLELLDFRATGKQETVGDTMLKSAFVTLRFLMEQAVTRGISIRRIALPLLGTGSQGIDTGYIAVPLYTQCAAMFSTIETLETIDFYELRQEKAEYLIRAIDSVRAAAPAQPHIFVSYSTRQIDFAHTVSDTLRKAGFSTWIAPESIPTGKDYMAEIPSAISGARLMVLLLTPEAQSSKWVRKEVGAAVGAGKSLFPMQLQKFEPNPEFRFVLEGEQIFPAWKYSPAELLGIMLEEIRSKIRP